MDFALTAAQQALIRDATALAARFTLDYWRERDRTETYPSEFVDACAAAGWFGAIIPTEYGGRGLGATEAALLLHAICASGAGTTGTTPPNWDSGVCRVSRTKPLAWARMSRR